MLSPIKNIVGLVLFMLSWVLCFLGNRPLSSAVSSRRSARKVKQQSPSQESMAENREMKRQNPTALFFDDLAPDLGDLELQFRLNHFEKHEAQRMVDSLLVLSFVSSMIREGRWSDTNKESTLQRFN
ncbi:unnamed protein product [Eruca vesicaria subsp. sativa]|uniref:Uncharacterized protein n=1 Tax=Eruca vesicaria subsp. sativa TaxID=29727 RepID=A0ABC8LTM1_ERUVS|nr:unnamed protein product [Eruca vesicaria subsp. sativa]